MRKTKSKILSPWSWLMRKFVLWKMRYDNRNGPLFRGDWLVLPVVFMIMIIAGILLLVLAI